MVMPCTITHPAVSGAVEQTGPAVATVHMLLAGFWHTMLCCEWCCNRTCCHDTVLQMHGDDWQQDAGLMTIMPC